MLGKFFRAYALQLVGGFAVGAVAVAAFQTVQLDGFKVGPVEIEGCRDRSARLETELRDATALLAMQGEIRAREIAQAVQSYGAQATACVDRVNTARDAGREIEKVTTIAKDMPGAAAAVPPIAADSLRRIIGQPVHSSAGSLPARNADSVASGTEAAR